MEKEQQDFHQKSRKDHRQDQEEELTRQQAAP